MNIDNKELVTTSRVVKAKNTTLPISEEDHPLVKLPREDLFNDQDIEVFLESFEK